MRKVAALLQRRLKRRQREHVAAHRRWLQFKDYEDANVKQSFAHEYAVTFGRVQEVRSLILAFERRS